MKRFSDSKTSLLSRALSVALALMLLLSAVCISASAESVAFDDSNALTDTLLLIDRNSGEVLYSKNSDVKRPMASTVKIMTCILALENITDLSEMITITSAPINDILGMGASTADFEDHIGESFSALDIIYGLMLPSGCDAAQVLAYHIGGTPEKFAKMMNKKAQELSCNDTYFTEGHGLSDNNYTTAQDLAKIAEYAFTLDGFAEIVSSEYYTPNGYSYPFVNTNYLIDEQNGREYYYKYATGVKTGYTDASGKCLVSTASKGDDDFMCIALGAPLLANDGYVNHAMTDSVDLYEWAFDNYTDNIEVELTSTYASMKIGGTLNLCATVTGNSTDFTPYIEWSSSDENIATVDENGVVTAKALGQAVITAKTQTGNFDTTTISCGFYNGIDVTSRYGDYTTGSKKPINWSAVKSDGFDFAVIRAGWGWEDYPYQNDAEFVNNVKGAYENDIPFYLSFVAYAQNKDEAKLEAEYFLKEMKNDFPTECADGLISVVYNMTYSQYSSNSKSVNTEVALTFAKELKNSGYNTVVFAGKSVFSNIDTEKLSDNSVGTYYSYYPYSVDFSAPITTPDGKIPQMWQYRSDGYFPHASENFNTKQSIVYMLSTFEDSLAVPSVDVELVSNNTVSISFSCDDLVAERYEIYELLSNDESKLIAQLDSDENSFVYTCQTSGEHRFVVRKIVTDTVSKEEVHLDSQEVSITTYEIMDVDHDTKVTIFDATYIQCCLAQLIDDADYEKFSDVNGDGKVTIMDVTHIQLFLAEITV